MATIVKDLPPPPEEEHEDVIERKVFPEEAGDEDLARRLQAEYDAGVEAASSNNFDGNNDNDNNSNNNHTHNHNRNRNDDSAMTAHQSVATLSNPWEFDVEQRNCSYCKDEFNPFNRRHHCRLCGKIFCNKCSDQRSLVPPSSIVLTPKDGKKATPQSLNPQSQNLISFTPESDPDRMLTYIDEDQQLLYGKGLEQRFQLAREPLRVCTVCYEELQPLQEELRTANSNAMRFNHIDPTDPKRFLNSPLAFTLGHEVRKAAYTLSNLLPLPKRMGSIVDAPSSRYAAANTDNFSTGDERDIQQCKDECATISPNFSNFDGVQIPARLLEEAKGVAVMTVAKAGFGLAGIEVGTGLVVARLGDHQQWSAPCAIGVGGISWGALIGAQVSDHVFLLMTDASVELMFNNNGNLQLGADIGVAIGPVGRALEADFAAAPGAMAPIYTYSLSKGLYAGISLDGKVIVTRNRVNEKFYGREVTGSQILTGEIPSPPAARPLYDALQRCHVYANNGNNSALRNRPATTHTMQGYPEQQHLHHPYSTSVRNQHQQLNNNMMQQQQHSLDYGDPLDSGGTMPPAANDQHSYAGTTSGMSDITSDPGY